MKRIVFENHRTTAAKVTAELIIHLEDPFPLVQMLFPNNDTIFQDDNIHILS